MFPPPLLRLAEVVLADARERKLRIATAESCTGGLIAALLTEIPGSSDAFDRGFVVYSNRAKSDLLGVPGDLIETGVWRGGMTIFMAALLKLEGETDRKVWVADSFEGLPVPASKTDGDDLSDVDHLKVSLEQVKANFARFDLLSDQVRFLKGWFCDTLPTAPIESIAVLRLDGDLYSSTMDALHNLYHKVSLGGYVIVDDYAGWDSCKAAVTDFLKEHDLDPEIKMIDWTGAYWKVEKQIQPIVAGKSSNGASNQHVNV